MVIGSFRNLPKSDTLLITANTLVLPQMWHANKSGYCLELTTTKMMMCFFLQGMSRMDYSIQTQGLRLTFQLASPVASDRFDSQAKTNFSLARYSDNLK